jgi:hypothetical protein
MRHRRESTGIERTRLEHPMIARSTFIGNVKERNTAVPRADGLGCSVASRLQTKHADA